MNAERRIVLVTGSNGRIGTEVMRRLTGRFSDVVGLDRSMSDPHAALVELAARVARTWSRP